MPALMGAGALENLGIRDARVSAMPDGEFLRPIVRCRIAALGWAYAEHEIGTISSTKVWFSCRRTKPVLFLKQWLVAAMYA